MKQVAAGQGTAELKEYIGIWQKERISKSAKEVCARPAYPGISRKTECRVYTETECGMKNCCFECIRRVSCKEFEGYCGDNTKATYKRCPEIIWE